MISHQLSNEDHDDFGGLHRDLCATGAAMDRKGVAVARAQVTLAAVFRDGASLELATVTGSVSGGLTAALTIAV